MAVFGQTFRKTDFAGPRAQMYEDPEDLFQQLVGHALSEEAPDCDIHVQTTKGKDGGIDVFAVSHDNPDVRILGSPLPLIVECKHHDEEAKSPVDNAFAEWKRVRKKIEEQAGKGWPGLYEPWRNVKGYIYCLSLCLTDAKFIELEKEIGTFFKELRNHSLTQIEHIKLMDWSKLAMRLNELPRVADAWLGARLGSILGHEEYMELLTGFKKYLKPSDLPFVPPDVADALNPTHIFERAAELAGRGGVLLLGPGGVGKTRTALEVATLAWKEGWRVLHVRAIEPGVTANDLLEAAVSGGGKVLFVLDYIDQMQTLDFSEFKRDMIPAAEKRGVRIAILANARPGIFRDSIKGEDRQSKRKLFFETLNFEPDYKRQERISDEIRKCLSPTALKVFGEETVRRLCGIRPIIAMFIARELEERAKLTTGPLEDFSHLRGGDLIEWLKKRLTESGIKVEQGEPFRPAEPSAEVIAAATALSVSPLSAVEMYAAISFSFPEETDRLGRAQVIIRMLCKMGWLEENDDIFEVAHDIVCDETLSRILHDEELAILRSGALEKLLAPSTARPRFWGRQATALGRLIGNVDLPEAFISELSLASRSWLNNHGEQLGKILISADPDQAAYAIGAIFSGEPWREAFIEHWERLVEPWLARYGEYGVARHIYYRVLSKGKEGTLAKLYRYALSWLRSHCGKLDAGFVLGPLLDRQDLGAYAAEAVEKAMAWLTTYGDEPDARFVLSPLMAREDLGDCAVEAVKKAMAWLKSHGGEPEAKFVLSHLLERENLDDYAVESVEKAMTWIAISENAKSIEARFVFNPLLGRRDIDPAVTKELIQFTLAWLSSHVGEPGAGFVLDPLLGREDLGDYAAEVVEKAMTWLAITENAESIEAQFVFHPLLGRQDLNPTVAKKVVQFSLVWLSSYLGEPEAQFVLHTLLGRKDLDDYAAEAMEKSMGWMAIAEHAKSIDAGFVLPPLLGRRDLDPAMAKKVVQYALAWISAYPEIKDAEFVLKNLLKNEAVTPAQRETCAVVALRRLDLIEDNKEKTFLLRWLLETHDLNPGFESRILKAAYQWVVENPTHPSADFVITRVLRNPNLSDPAWKEIAEIALEWLRITPPDEYRNYLLNCFLIPRNLLTNRKQKYICNEAIAWLTHTCRNPGAARSLLKNLEKNYPGLSLDTLKQRWLK